MCVLIVYMTVLKKRKIVIYVCLYILKDDSLSKTIIYNATIHEGSKFLMSQQEEHLILYMLRDVLKRDFSQYIYIKDGEII